MKSILRALFLVSSILFGLVLAACSTAQQQSAAADLAKLQTVVENGCLVVQPTLMSVAALDPAVGAAATANGLFCATAGALTVTSVQTLLNTGIPAIANVIAKSTLIPADQKPIATAALGVFALTVTNALSVYNQAATTAATSSAVPASAPVAASQ